MKTAAFAALLAMLFLTGAGPATPAPFPYQPPGAGPDHPVPLTGGAAFRAAMHAVTTAAKKAGWVRVEWGQYKDGGSVSMTFARPEPDLRMVVAFFKWNMFKGRGHLDYMLRQRPAATLVHGFPLCLGPVEGGVVPGKGAAKQVFLAYCDTGGYGATSGDRPSAWPGLYGWKAVGTGRRGIVYERDGRFVEVWTKSDEMLDRLLNLMRFDGRHDPRSRR